MCPWVCGCRPEGELSREWAAAKAKLAFSCASSTCSGENKTTKKGDGQGGSLLLKSRKDKKIKERPISTCNLPVVVSPGDFFSFVAWWVCTVQC